MNETNDLPDYGTEVCPDHPELGDQRRVPWTIRDETGALVEVVDVFILCPRCTILEQA